MLRHGFNIGHPYLSILLTLTICYAGLQTTAAQDLKTWDGQHAINAIEVSIVYFLPADRTPLADWKDRVDYYAGRLEAFHAREYQGQSKLTVKVHPEPFTSNSTTAELREGDANKIFFRTLREVAVGTQFPNQPQTTFPILLVLSDINWRPLEDFYRVQPISKGFQFEGHLIDGYHFPGATSGGARAAYLAREGVGWGLVSADGWRVPYRGSDCVAYHEGIGHTVGLPHPEPGNGSVMSLGQYRGWINESWLDNDQKQRLGWQPPESKAEHTDLFSLFTALPDPRIPTPSQNVSLQCTWPENAQLTSLNVDFQTALNGRWHPIDVKLNNGLPPSTIPFAPFAEETPVSYRIRAITQSGESVELWGYFQVRSDPNQPLIPSKDQVPEQDRSPYVEPETNPEPNASPE